MKLETLTEYKPKPSPTVKLSPIACQAWIDVLRVYMEGKYDIKYIVIPVIAYYPNTDSDDGTESQHKFISVTYNTIEKEISSIPVDTFGKEIALSRNILVVEKGLKPKYVTLDIIDVKPNCDESDLQALTKYDILKTNNSFHLYPKTNVSSGNGGEIVKDKYWKQEYIRVTESDAKGSIEKYIFPPKPT